MSVCSSTAAGVFVGPWVLFSSFCSSTAAAAAAAAAAAVFVGSWVLFSSFCSSAAAAGVPVGSWVSLRVSSTDILSGVSCGPTTCVPRSDALPAAPSEFAPVSAEAAGEHFGIPSWPGRINQTESNNILYIISISRYIKKNYTFILDYDGIYFTGLRLCNIYDGTDFIHLYTGFWAKLLNLFLLPAGNGGVLPLGRWDLKPRLSNGKLSGRHSGFDLLDMAGNVVTTVLVPRKIHEHLTA